MKIRTSDEGSLLLSTFHLLFFVSFLILSLTSIVYSQLMQLQQMSQAYEAKALIELSESLLREKLEWEEVETATIHFSQGRVEIAKESAVEYAFTARLINGYTSRMTVAIAADPGQGAILSIPENQESVDVPLTDESSNPRLDEESIEPLDETEASQDLNESTGLKQISND